VVVSALLEEAQLRRQCSGEKGEGESTETGGVGERVVSVLDQRALDTAAEEALTHTHTYTHTHIHTFTHTHTHTHTHTGG
jgi:hypothetical protein